MVLSSGFVRTCVSLTIRRCLAAVRRGGPVFPVFIWSPEEEGRWQPGAASRWWLHQSLDQLDTTLRRLGSRLIIRRGPALEAIRELAAQSGATAVYWNRRHEPSVVNRDRNVTDALHRDGLTAESFNSCLLFEPWTVHTQKDQPYQVFSPFWKACLGQPEPAPPEEAPSQINIPAHWPASLKLIDLDLEPAIDWTGGLRASWRPGEVGASEQLNRFLEEALSGYATERDRPDRAGTSRLSPHLHFGEISVRQIWHTVRGAATRLSNPQARRSDPRLLERAWLAGVRSSSALPLSADARTAASGGVYRLSPGDRAERTSARGSVAAPGIPSSTPVCASCGTRVGCTTACAWSWHRFWSRTC